VDVIRDIASRIGLGVHELDQEGRPLNPVVVPDARLGRSGPGEVDLVVSGRFDFLQSSLRHMVGHRAAVLGEQSPHLLLLGLI
jgi:hypothetical protein